jgi:hypothetical protein
VSPIIPWTPADEASPKQMHVSIAKLSSLNGSLTTVPGHSVVTNGMVRYASATSLTAALVPSGSEAISAHTAPKVPQAQGKLSVSIAELTDMTRGHLGYDRSCMILYLLACPGLGMMEMGNV